MPVNTGTQSKQPRSDTAKRLLNLMQTKLQLFHDRETPYAGHLINGHIEYFPLRTRSFREWMWDQYYKQYRTPASSRAIEAVLQTLCGMSMAEPERKTFLRVAHDNGKIYIDLANDAWKVIEIGPAGWKVLENPGSPVIFKRSKRMLPLPIPERGGSLDDLQPFLNCRNPEDLTDQSGWMLITAWLLGAYSKGPYPILGFIGQHGSAKTTTARILKSLIDPSAGGSKAKPRDEQDLWIAAVNSHVLALDNLSSISDWLSDALCRLSTGGALSTRQLYTDDEESVIEAMVPVIVNGIADLMTRGDLSSRAIVVTMPAIEDWQRKAEREFWEEFEAAKPKILGAIYTILSEILVNLPKIKLSRAPRMADFAAWITAAEPALNWVPGSFLDIYNDNQESTSQTLLDNSPIGSVLVKWFDSLKTPNGKQEWEGSAQDLLDALINSVVGLSSSQMNALMGLKVAQFGGELRRLAPVLRTEGIEIVFQEPKKSQSKTKRLILVRPLVIQKYQGVVFNQQVAP